jgi:uncharacterized protein (TIGR03435 family)
MLKYVRSTEYKFVLLIGYSCLLFLSCVVAASGQTSGVGSRKAQSPAGIAFDISTVRVSKSGTTMSSIAPSLNGFSATNVSFGALLENAYGFKQSLIYGLPQWMNGMRFDVNAKVSEPDINALSKLSNKERLAQLQPILEDRFKLHVHTETKEFPTYDLVLAKGGAKLEKVSTAGNENTGIISKAGELIGDAVTVEGFAYILGYQVQRPIVDKTGLTGRYNFRLRWTPDGIENKDAMSGPSIFTALQEQLGLKLQPSRGPVKVLIIDHVEAPSSN